MSMTWITLNSEIDTLTRERTFLGRITKSRWAALSRWARRNTTHLPHCGHEYDCCGCPCSTRATVTRIAGGLSLTQTIGFNY